jgi:hypothetical protein
VDEIGHPDLKTGWWRESMSTIEALWKLTRQKDCAHRPGKMRKFNGVSPLLLTFGPHPLHKIPQFRPALGHPPESPHALAHRPIVATGHLAAPLHPSPTQVPRRHSHHPIPPPVSMSPAHLFPASPQACTSVPNRSGSSDTHPINRRRSSSRRNTVSTPVARLMTGYQPSETWMRSGRAMRPESATTPICH